jgi:hypothetical protein
MISSGSGQRWPCIETGAFADGKGYDNRALYEDHCVRSGGRWRFQHRRYLYLWLSSEPLPGAPVALGDELSSLSAFTPSRAGSFA